MRIVGRISLAILVWVSFVLLNSCEAKQPAAQADNQRKEAEPSTSERQAQVDACRSQLANLAARVGLFQAVANTLPESVDILLVGDQPEVARQLTDPWNNKVEYIVTGSTFTLCSLGPDDVSGTPDDICHHDEARGNVVVQTDSPAPPPACPIVKVTFDCRKTRCVMKLPVLRMVEALQTVLLANPKVTAAISLPDLLKKTYYVLQGSKPEFNVIPEAPDQRAQLLLLLEMALDDVALLDSVASMDRRETSILLDLVPSTPDDLRWLEQEASNATNSNKEAPIRVTVTRAVDCASAKEAFTSLLKLHHNMKMVGEDFTVN